jgi:integrase
MLAKKPLTDRGIAALKSAPLGKRQLVWDAMVPGLAVRVTDKGTKAFVLVGRFPGSSNPTARAIGRVGAISLEDARHRARDWLSLIAQGHDPASTSSMREAGSLQAVCLKWLARDGAKLRSVANLRSSLERNVLPILGARPIGEIKRSEIVELLDRLEDERGPVAANRALAMLRRIMNWHATRSDDFRSPIVRGLARAEIARDRVLNDDELRKVWRAASPLVPSQPSLSPVFSAFVRFLLLTGARRNEALHMNWSEVSGGDWTLPASRNKTGVELIRPLSGAAQGIIVEMPKACEFIFSRNGKHAMGGLSQLKAQLDYASGTSGWTLHDLRRTARSLMSRAGVPSDHAERCLGHVIGGVRGVYDRHPYRAEMLHAYEALATLIAGIVDPQPNVVAMRRN